MGHGSRKYQRSWVQYESAELKLIRRVWQEVCGTEFKQDSRVDLDELVEQAIGTHNVLEAKQALRPYRLQQVEFQTRAQHCIDITHMKALSHLSVGSGYLIQPSDGKIILVK